jgi:hypothetical protein
MPETLFLAASLIDRYLSVVQVARKNLQLVRGARGASQSHPQPPPVSPAFVKPTSDRSSLP